MSDSSVLYSRLAALLRLAEPRLELLPVGDVEWSEVCQFAIRNGCAGLLKEALDRHGITVPDSLVESLRDRACAIGSANLAHRALLESVAGAFERCHVSLMVLKGAALNMLLYDRLDVRPAADLDLLIKPRNADDADHILKRAGFERGPAYVRHDFYPRFHYEMHYVRDGFCIDLHVRPFRLLRYMQTVPEDALWSTSHVLPLGSSSVRVCSHEEMFLHLAVHAAIHGARRLVWLVDIQRYAARYGHEISWSRVVRTARQWGLSAPLLMALERVMEVLGATWPDETMRALRETRPNWRDRLALAQAPHDATSPVRHVLVNLLTTRGWRFRAAYLAAMLCPGADHMRQSYRRRHAGWLPVAHLLRFGRAALRPLGIR